MTFLFRLGVSLTCVGLAMVVAGCTNQSNVEPPSSQASNTVGSSPTRTQSTGPPASVAVGGAELRTSQALQAVAGKDYQAIRTLSGIQSREQAYVDSAVTSTGTLVGALTSTDRSGRLHSESVVLKDPFTGKMTYLRRPGPHAAASQMTGAASDNHWVVWTETRSTDPLITDPWMLFSYDRATAQVRQIAAAPHMAGGTNPAAPGSTVPSLASNGRVYLDVVRQVGPNRFESEVDSVPADGSGSLRREAIGSGPMASGDKLVFANGKGRLKVYERDLTTGHTVTLFDSVGTSCDRIFGLGIAGPVIAWGLRCQGTDVVQVLHDGHIAATIQGHGLGYLEVASGYVGFASGSGPYQQYFFDLGPGRLLKIGSGILGGDMPGNGRFLTWKSYQDPTSYGTLHLVQLLH